MRILNEELECNLIGLNELKLSSKLSPLHSSCFRWNVKKRFKMPFTPKKKKKIDEKVFYCEYQAVN
jgi:hypothetical protein